MMRILFIAVISILSSLGFLIVGNIKHGVIAGAFGLLIAFLITIMEVRSQRLNAVQVLSSFVGILIGGLFSYIVILILNPLQLNLSIRIAILFTGSYTGFILFYSRANEFKLFKTGLLTEGKDDQGGSEKLYKILDTSAIIDGRISDIAETGFLDGIFVVPRFVLNELQLIADSPDSIKRQRGRRGLDILNKMQKSVKTIVQISDKDFPEIKVVDPKLIKLAKVMRAKVVTSDFNLNKVAEIQDVKVLNINELSNSLKPIVLPGEELTVTIIKEGKHEKQGVGYLDDGTMIVVDNGKDYLGKTVDVIVTSVLQTQAGRMIFAK